jgi:uncharacterized protein YigA (DUF484 family)
MVKEDVDDVRDYLVTHKEFIDDHIAVREEEEEEQKEEV